MSEEREGLPLAVVASGVIALAFPTALQVMWLIAVVVAAVLAVRANGRERPDP